MLRPSFGEVDAQRARFSLHRSPVQAHAGTRVLRRQTNHRSLFHPVRAHLANHVGNVGAPVAHAHVDRHGCALRGQFRFHQPALLQGDLGQRAAADQRIAVLNLFDDLLRQRPPADHVAQIFGNLLDGLRGSVGQQQHGLFSHWPSPGGTRAPSAPRPAHSPPALSGTMPWPRLKMWPGRPLAARRISLTRSSRTSSGAKSVMGSRLPCTAWPWPTARQPSSSGCRQSRPITSAPVAAISRQQARRLHAKINHRHAHLLHGAHQPLRRLEGIIAIVGQPQRADPAIEDLDHVRARLHLQTAILLQHLDNLVQQQAPRQRCRGTSSAWCGCNCASRRPSIM